MSVVSDLACAVGEEQALAAMRRDGFDATTKDYAPGKTDPHQHDYDISLYVLEGEIRVTELDADAVHVCKPGDKLFVASGTRHCEEHGPLRMVVGRRRANA